MRYGLVEYRMYRNAVDGLRIQAPKLDDFTASLKKDPELIYLRSRARAELQALYNDLTDDLDLPDLPVYFPVRKKVFVYGATYHADGVPSEIRIYSLKGCSNKSYDKWTPRDIRACTETEVFETFIHESAHVLEAIRSGRMGHGKPFIKAYENIEEYFLNRGLENLIDPKIRLMGVPGA